MRPKGLAYDPDDYDAFAYSVQKNKTDDGKPYTRIISSTMTTTVDCVQHPNAMHVNIG